MSAKRESLGGKLARECKEGQRRKRTKFDKNQYKILTEAFENDRYPDINDRVDLANRTKIPEPRIQVWFQNRRARVPKNTQKVEAHPPVPGRIQNPGVCAPVPGPTQATGVCAPADSPIQSARVCTPIPGSIQSAGVCTPVEGPVLGAGVCVPVLGPVQRAGVCTPVVGSIQGTGVCTPVEGPVLGAGVCAPVPGSIQGTEVCTPVEGPVLGAGVCASVPGPVQGAGVCAPVPGPVQGAGVCAPVPGPVQVAGVCAPVLGPVQDAGVRAPVPGSSQAGLCAPDCSCQQGLRDASLFWKSEDASGPAVFLGYRGILGVHMASPDPETPADALGEPAGDLHYSHFSSFSPKVLTASQQPFSQLEADSARTHFGNSGPLLTCGNWALRGWEKHPPSGEQPWWSWQSPPALQPETAPQQLRPQNPETWEPARPGLPLVPSPTFSSPPSPLPLEPWPNPAFPQCPMGPQHYPVAAPARQQEQFPSLPLRKDVSGKP